MKSIQKEIKGLSFEAVKKTVIAGATRSHISECEMYGLNPEVESYWLEEAKAATTWDDLGWVVRNLGLCGAEADEAEMRSYGACMRYDD